MRWLKSIFTDEQWDADGVLIATLLMTVFTGYLQYKAPDFDPEKFGQGIAYILGGGGLGYAAKRYGEKRGDKDVDNSTSPAKE